jgi:hypothetical protein
MAPIPWPLLFPALSQGVDAPVQAPAAPAILAQQVEAQRPASAVPS